MKIATFWKLIDESRAAATQAKDHAETLTEMLTALEVKEIIAFEGHLLACQYAFDSNRGWLCCYLLCDGYTSEGGIQDFMRYLISQGRAVFETALRDPDLLADLVPLGDEWPRYERFGGVAFHAYNRKTGRWFDEDGIAVKMSRATFVRRELATPDGGPISLQNAPKCLPRLYRRFMAGVRRSVEEAKEQYRSEDPTERRRSIWTFSRFASHSKEAADVLSGATNDPDAEVRNEAEEGWGMYWRATERT
jgi:hypothetical protein